MASGKKKSSPGIGPDEVSSQCHSRHPAVELNDLQPALDELLNSLKVYKADMEALNEALGEQLSVLYIESIRRQLD